MVYNTSAPPGPVVPRLIYEDVSRAIDWLRGAFGFTERLRTPAEPDGTIHHAQLEAGDGSVILTGQPAGQHDFNEAVMVRVRDIDAHYERARQFGAKILMEPGTKEFGERQYSAEDFAGKHWAFTESVADAQPESWGGVRGTIIHPYHRTPRPHVCYLQIPAIDAHQSAAFYENVFGWNIRRRESDEPAFDDAAGHVSGGFFTNLKPMREAGIIVSIWVDDIDVTLALVVANGGEVVMPRRHDHPDSNSWIANFRDPAGNVMGLYQEPL